MYLIHTICLRGGGQCVIIQWIYLSYLLVFIYLLSFFWVAGVGGILTSSGPTASSQYNSPRGKYSKLRD